MGSKYTGYIFVGPSFSWRFPLGLGVIRAQEDLKAAGQEKPGGAGPNSHHSPRRMIAQVEDWARGQMENVENRKRGRQRWC